MAKEFDNRVAFKMMADGHERMATDYVSRAFDIWYTQLFGLCSEGNRPLLMGIVV